MAKRRYSDQERAEALAAVTANGGNVNLTAGQIGVPFTTLIQWVRQQRHPEATQMSEQKKPLLADRLEEVAGKLLDAIAGKIEGASLQQIATAMGIAIDKARLLRGEPTTINEEKADAARRNLTAADLASALALAREAGLAVSPDGGAKPVDTACPPRPPETVPAPG